MFHKTVKNGPISLVLFLFSFFFLAEIIEFLKVVFK